MLCALIRPEPEERTDLGAKSPERVFTNFIRVSCESASEADARGVGISAIAHIAINTLGINTTQRVTDLLNLNS
jgi:hypothetical protein